MTSSSCCLQRRSTDAASYPRKEESGEDLTGFMFFKTQIWKAFLSSVTNQQPAYTMCRTRVKRNTASFRKPLRPISSENLLRNSAFPTATYWFL